MTYQRTELWCEHCKQRIEPDTQFDVVEKVEFETYGVARVMHRNEARCA